MHSTKNPTEQFHFFFVTPDLVPDHTLNPRPHYKSYGFTKILQKGIKAIDGEYGFLGGLTEVSDEAMYLRPSHPDWPQNKTSGSLVNDIPQVSPSVSILVHRSFYNSWLKCPRTRSKKKERKKEEEKPEGTTWRHTKGGNEEQPRVRSLCGTWQQTWRIVPAWIMVTSAQLHPD